MTTTCEAATVTADLVAAVDECAAVPLPSLVEDELLSVVRQLEQTRRRLEAMEYRLISELDERNLPGKHLMPSTSDFLASLLNLSPREAGRRVRHARQLGPRITVTGERLPPLLPATAAARAAGEITEQHATVIIGTIDKLPTTLPVVKVANAEAFLVEQARNSTRGRSAGSPDNCWIPWIRTAPSRTRTPSAADGSLPWHPATTACTG